MALRSKLPRCTHFAVNPTKLAWLDRAYRQRDGLTYMKVDPLLKSLRHDPRYAELLNRMNMCLSDGGRKNCAQKGKNCPVRAFIANAV